MEQETYIPNLSPLKSNIDINNKLSKIMDILKKPIFSIILISVAIIGILGFFFVFIPTRQLMTQVNLAKLRLKI